MVDRTVKVTLNANIAGYKTAMEEAAKVTRETGTEAEKLAQKKEAFQLLGTTMFVAGAAMAAGLGLAVAKFADFDQAMSLVGAATRESAENMALLRQASLDAGAQTVFSATEAANAVEELAKAGVSTADILSGGLDGALALAAAGGLGVAEAAGIAATALKTFNLEGSDMGHVADLLAAGAGKAMGDVTDLSGALNQSAMVAKSTGLSIEETTATLAAFASQGLIGSDAGTSFKSMLQRLTPQSTEAKNKMEELGIAAYDASGQFIGMEKFAGNLEGALKGLTPEQRNSAMATIFGSDAVRAANVLYSEGESGIRDWIAAVDDQGYAAEQAAMNLDNLAGDWEALSGAMDSGLISMGAAADGPLRGLVQGLTELVDVFNDMPEGGKQAVFWVGAAASAAMLAGGVYLLAIPKVVAYQGAVALLGTTAQNAARMVGTLGKVGGAGLGIAVVMTAAAAASVAFAREIRGTDEAVTKATTTNHSFIDSMNDVNRSTDASAEQVKRAFDAIANGEWFGPVGNDISVVRDALTELGKGMEGLPVDAAVAKFQAWGDELGLSRDQMSTMLSEMPQLEGSIRAHLKAAGGAADAQSVLNFAMEKAVPPTKDNTKALEALAGQAESAEGKVEDLADTIRNFGSAQFDVRGATRSFEQAIDDLTESVTTNGTSLDLNTQKGRDNEAAIDDLARSALDLAGATYTQTGSQEEATKVLELGRGKLIEMLGQFGITGQAAEDYADKLGLVPANIGTTVEVLGVDLAMQAADNIRAAFARIPNYKGITVDTIIGNPSLGYKPNATGNIYDAKVKSFAGGGVEPGIYPYTPGGIHKFAEEYGEAYISMDPARKTKSVGVWQETGRRLGAMAAGQSMPSLEGMAISGTLAIGGDGLGRIIDGRIVKSKDADARRFGQGGF